MSYRFYSNSLLGIGKVSLFAEEARHVAVTRIRLGEKVILFNGDGYDYISVFAGIDRREAHFRVEEITPNGRELSNHLIIGAPLPKGDREQFMIEKLVELGIAGFVPLETERSKIHPEPKRLDRLKKHVIEASKQCGRSQLMQIGSLTPWHEFLAIKKENQLGWVAHGPNKSQFSMHKIDAINDPTLGAIGPEGGLTDKEVEQAQVSGWKVVELGKRIMRIETAAIVLAWEMGRRTEMIT